MSTPDQRARDRDRDEAVRVVDAACADGQIVEADRLKRVEELRNARTLGEIAMITHDLRPVVTAPAGAAPAPGRGSTRDPVPTPHRGGGAVGAAVLLVILVIVVGGGAVLGLVDVGGSGTDRAFTSDVASPEVTQSSPPVRLDLLTRGHYRALVQATQRTTASTRAVRLVLQRLSGEVDTPGIGTSRTVRLSWDGATMRRERGKPSGATRQFDLNSVDVGLLRGLVERVRQTASPRAPYRVVVLAPDPGTGAMYTVSAGRGRNTATLVATADGTVLRQSRS